MNFIKRFSLYNKIIYVSLLCFVLLLAVCFFVVDKLAFADPTGTIKIESSQKSTSFDGYRIFSASIDASENVSYVSWTSDDNLKNAVVAYLDDNDCADSLNANTAISFIKDKIASDDRIYDTDIAKDSSFAAGLARSIMRTNPKPEVSQTFSANDIVSLEQGYWLFVSSNDSLDNGNNGTAPIWISIKNGDKVLHEKSSGITFNKHLLIDGKPSKATDANKDEQIEFELCASLPDNFEAFSAYSLMFTDTLPSGMRLADGVSSIKIFDNDEDITPAHDSGMIQVKVEDSNISINFADMTMGTHRFTKDSNIMIRYKAFMESSAVLGAGGNINIAHLNFTNDPVSLAHCDFVSTDNKSVVYAYSINGKFIDANKDKSAEGFPLAGCKFTLFNSDSGLYVQSDGSLNEVPYEFISSEDGSFSINTVSSGKYTLHQTESLSGYKVPKDDVIINIKSKFESETLKELTASVEGGFVPPIFGNWFNNTISADLVTGSVDSVICNSESSYLLPTTGFIGILVSSISAIVLFVICFAGFIRLSNKK